MLEGVHRDDNICPLICRRHEGTGILNPGPERCLSCYLENLLTYINTDDAFGSPTGHLYGVRSLATTEVDDHFPGNPVEEAMPQLNRELRLAFVSRPATTTWRPG